MKNIFKFFKIKNEKTDTKMKKLEDRNLKQAITNYESLKKEFKKTKWEKFFDE